MRSRKGGQGVCLRKIYLRVSSIIKIGEETAISSIYPQEADEQMHQMLFDQSSSTLPQFEAGL